MFFKPLAQLNKNKKSPVVLICPLDWGLGHAARSIPVIKAFLAKDCKLIIGSDEEPLAFLQGELLNEAVSYIKFPWKKVKYHKNSSFFLKLFIQLPVILYSIFKEHRELKKIIKKTKADIVISDNRFGLWTKRAISVFITHQVFIKAPRFFKWTEPLLFQLNKFFFSKFDYCWVPDLPGEVNLSGDLSHKNEIKDIKYIGILSRFSESKLIISEKPLPADFPNEYILIMLSGPEPQRSILEQKLHSEVDKTGVAAVFLRGKAGTVSESFSEKKVIFNHLESSKIKYLIENAEFIICRSGYSTLMDLSFFGKKAILIPTPGQTEQEYLGEWLDKKNMAVCVKQSKIDLRKQICFIKEIKGLPQIHNNNSLLKAAIDELLEKH